MPSTLFCVKKQFISETQVAQVQGFCEIKVSKQFESICLFEE